MIKANDNGAIIVEIDDNSYNLSDSAEYASFLMWLTSADSTAVIHAGDFAISQDMPESLEAKAKRYSAFLQDFASRRASKLAELNKALSAEQRETAINDFISRLKEADQQ